MATSPTFPAALPSVGAEMVNEGRDPRIEWYSFFSALFGRTGGNTANGSVLLDTITNAQGSMLFRGLALWQGLALGLSGQVLQVAASKPAWNFITGANFAAQSANHFLAGPASGASATPTFRDIASLDLDPLLGQYPGTAGNTAASSGNIGEFIANSNTAALTSGAAADIASIALSPGDWDVWGNFSTQPAGATTTTIVRAWINTTSATDPGAPNGGAYLLQQQSFAAGLGQSSPVGMMRVSLAAGTTIFLSANVTFAGGTLGGGGFIGARRTH